MSGFRARVREILHRGPPSHPVQTYSPISSERHWLDLQSNSQPNGKVKMPHEYEFDMREPRLSPVDESKLDKIQGSMIGMAIGDAMGAHVEFRPHEYLLQNPVEKLQGGGTWGLKEGQFTDDTSMALCLAASLIVRQTFSLYDQLVRYKWWYRHGYMSSTGECFDIGTATRESLQEFEQRQKKFARNYEIKENIDFLSDGKLLEKFDVNCSRDGVAGNGALMRLAPIPLFFYRNPSEAVKYSGQSAEITHGDRKAVDACRYYGALIVAALQGYTKDQILDRKFYSIHKKWFGEKKLCEEILTIAKGSYQRYGGYNDGIRGSGYIVKALEAALWAFWSDEGSFSKGVLKAVNLGDDTDTTAAIYGQLAGAYYGFQQLPQNWVKQIYAKRFILNVSKWLCLGPKPLSSSTTKTKTKESPPAGISTKPMFVDHSSTQNSFQLPSTEPKELVQMKSNESKLRQLYSTPSTMSPAPVSPRRTDSVFLGLDLPPEPLRRTEVPLQSSQNHLRSTASRFQDQRPMNLTTTPVVRTQEMPTRPYVNGDYPPRTKTAASKLNWPHDQLFPSGRADTSTGFYGFSFHPVDPRQNEHLYNSSTNFYKIQPNSFVENRY